MIHSFQGRRPAQPPPPPTQVEFFLDVYGPTFTVMVLYQYWSQNPFWYGFTVSVIASTFLAALVTIVRGFIRAARS